MSTSAIDATGSEKGKRLALIIGVNEAPRSYRSPLHHAVADAEAIAAVVEQYGKFTLLTPSLVGEQATSDAVKKAVLNLMRDRMEDDVLLLYFSGHGIYLPVEREDQPGVDLVYLVTSDFCEREAEEDPTLYLSMRWLRDNLVIKTRAGQVLLILDCCYAGEIGRTGPDPQYRDLLQQIASYFRDASAARETKPGGLRLALTATSALQPSKEGDEHGVMTEPLLHALRGEVLDVIGNEGQITVTRLYGYLHETMPTGQKPSFSGDAAAKNYILAWHPERLAELRKKPSHVIVNERPKSYIPFPHSALFQPRPGEFEQLERLLFDQETGHKPTRLGLVGVLGLAGVGKTQLAIELAHRYEDRFPAGIFWMPATGTIAFDWQKPLAELAEKTEYLPANDDPSDRENEARRARHLCRYLASHRDALLILDNVEDPSLVTSALPALAGGEVACTLLYTSRNTVAPPGAIPHVVEQLPEEGALRLLLETTRPSLLPEVGAESQSAEAKAAREICRTVGYLPLALMHLRGLLARDQQMSLEQLNEVLKQRGVLDLEKKTQSGDVAPLFTTFWLSWEKVHDKEAQRLFKLAAYFPEATPIPLWLLGLAAGLGEDFRYPNLLWEARVGLQELSLMETLSGDQVRLHPLVRAFGQQLVAEESDKKGKALLEEAGGRLAIEFADLKRLENRVLRVGYWGCLEQVRATGNYMELIESSQIEHPRRIERWLDRESYLLADDNGWRKRLPGLLYQQLLNHAVEEGAILRTGEAPAVWIQQVNQVGAEDRQLLRTFAGHTNSVRSVAFSPDGRQVLTGSHDGTARLWEANSGKQLMVFEVVPDDTDDTRDTGWRSIPFYPICVVFSPDGSQVLTGCVNGPARLWEANSGKRLMVFKEDVQTIRAYNDAEANSGKRLIRFKSEQGAAYSVAFSPDGRQVLTGCWNGRAYLWDTSSGKQLTVFEGHTNSMNSVTFSPDGRRVLTGSHDGTARLWDTSSGQQLAVFEGHTKSMNHVFSLSVAFSPDGRQVLTGSDDGTVRLWEANSGKQVAVFKGHTDHVNSVAFSPDGKKVLTGSRDGTVRLWEANSGKQVAVLESRTQSVNSVAFSPDGRQVLTGSDDGTARLWVTSSSKQGAAFDGHTDVVRSVAFSPDGKKVLTGSSTGTARLWEANSGKQLAVFKGHTGWVRSVAFSPDGKKVLTGSGDGTARLWETSRGKELMKLKEDTGAVRSVAFSPDGKKVLTGSSTGTTRLWETSSGKESMKFKSNRHAVIDSDTLDVISESSDPICVAFDPKHTGPEGNWVITASNYNIAYWWVPNDRSFASNVKEWDGHRSEVNSVAFSPDGGQVLTGSDDGTARLWEANSGQQLAVVKGNTGSVMSVGFSPDGNLIVMSDENGHIMFWRAHEPGRGRLLGMYVASYEIKAVYWHDATTIVLADAGGTRGRPYCYHLKLHGMK